jgi:superfamily II DNA/RNA helicase
MPAESSAVPETGLPAADVTFASLGVPKPLVEVLADDGITAPFPVQAVTLPDALAGRDILGRARTGSGKTLGFSLPLVSRLAGGSTKPCMPRGLVLVPTRELATQVTDVLKPLARAMELWVTTIYGGVSYGPQVNALQRRTDIVVATPGRLADLISQGECDLSDVEVTVIDEADQMADLGFLPIVRRLLETTPADGQRMLFSATLDAAIDVLARRFLQDPVQHTVDENSSPAEIEHHVLTIEPGLRVEVVAALAGGDKRSLVFTRTKHGAERLARQLTEAGIPAAELHGNLRQGARSRNLAAFASGLASVMIATDIAARGIHIDGIDLVVHADPPAEHKAYVHRSGRTARGGADGVVVTLQTRSQAREVTAMMRKAGITPHDAVAVHADSAELREIAGPPADRVSMAGKVAELVRPEDRLAANDRPGAGKPWEGRPRRDRGRRDDRPRARASHGPGRPAREDRSERPVRLTRDARDERFQRDERDGRPARAERQEGFPRDDREARPSRDDRVNRDDRYSRDDRPQRTRRDSGAGQAYRDDRPARAYREDERPARFDRNERPARVNSGDRPARPEGRGGTVAGRRDQRNGNEWYPRSTGQGGRKPGGSVRAFGDRNREGAQVSAGGPARDGRPAPGSRIRDERAGRGDRSYGADRQAAPRDGTQSARGFGGPTGRSGYSAGRNQAGKRRAPGQGRHY